MGAEVDPETGQVAVFDVGSPADARSELGLMAEQFECHGSKFALIELAPLVADLTLCSNILPSMLA
jgi:hypothetical protein